MICNRKYQVIMCLTIFCAVIFFPFHLFAENNTETLEFESGFYYTVQKGDTLWDLSQRFSDSAWLWPGLWEENSQIANPHWIYPGERIRLFHLKGVEKYVLKAVEKKPEPLVVQESPKELPFYYYSPIDGIGFVKKTPVMPQGIIFKVKDEKTLISQGDLVFIKPQNNHLFTVGKKYTIYRTLDPIVDKKTNALIGVQHYLTGVLEITENKPLFAIAKVVQSFRSIQVNDLLMPYTKRSPKIILTESAKGLQGKIILAEEHGTIMGDNTVAFIDKGQDDGVNVGQFYRIFYQEKQKVAPENREAVLLTPLEYGTLLVLHAERTTATVLITQSSETIEPYASFQSPGE